MKIEKAVQLMNNGNHVKTDSEQLYRINEGTLESRYSPSEIWFKSTLSIIDICKLDFELVKHKTLEEKRIHIAGEGYIYLSISDVKEAVSDILKLAKSDRIEMTSPHNFVLSVKDIVGDL